jgi:predicted phosphoribosyltransferase
MLATGLFTDRRQAGQSLARVLHAFRGDALILGVPRGGVAVAREVAAALGADLDVTVARKIGAPGQPELAIGAVSANGVTFLDDELVQMFGVSDTWLAAAAEEQRLEARSREQRLRGGRPRRPIKGRTVIIVDDGLATGATMRAAVRAVLREQPARVIAAAPVGSIQACAALRLEADEVVCPNELADFGAVGLYYEKFPQVSDEEVVQLLGSVRVTAPG